MAPVKHVHKATATSSQSAASAHHRVARSSLPVSSVLASAPANGDAPKAAEICYWPVGEEVVGSGPGKWPDVRYLCFLTEWEAWKYERDFYFMAENLEPIVRLPGCHVNQSHKWINIFPIWADRHKWNVYTSHNVLSTTFDRNKREMETVIRLHNQRISGKSLEERAKRTIAFLRIIRDAVDNDMALKRRRGERMPLIPSQDKLVLVTRKTPVIHGTDITTDDPHSKHPALPARYQEGSDGMDAPDDLEFDEEGLEFEGGEETDVEVEDEESEEGEGEEDEEEEDEEQEGDDDGEENEEKGEEDELESEEE